MLLVDDAELVRFSLLCAQRSGLQLPVEMWMHIFDFLQAYENGTIFSNGALVSSV